MREEYLKKFYVDYFWYAGDREEKKRRKYAVNETEMRFLLPTIAMYLFFYVQWYTYMKE